jgi:hypothetical protein
VNTLSKAITNRWFTSPEAFATIERAWKAYVNSSEGKTLSSAHFLLYAALRGKDWRKGFVHEDKLVAPHAQEQVGESGWRPNVALRQIHQNATIYTWLPRGKADADKPADYHGAYRTTTLLGPFGGSVTAEMLEAVREVLPMDIKSLSEEPYIVREVSRV